MLLLCDVKHKNAEIPIAPAVFRCAWEKEREQASHQSYLPGCFNRVCDELGNTCGANDAAIQACLDAQQSLIDQGLGVGSDGEDVLTAFNDAILAA